MRCGFEHTPLCSSPNFARCCAPATASGTSLCVDVVADPYCSSLVTYCVPWRLGSIQWQLRACVHVETRAVTEWSEHSNCWCVLQGVDSVGMARTRRSPSPASPVPAAALIRRYRWVQRQLIAHNLPFMPLPSSPTACHCATSDRFIEGISRASAPHVVISSTPQPSSQDSHCSGAGGRGGGQFTAALATGACPVLWQHTRLNMILPATAATAVAGCALSAAAGGTAPSAAHPALASEVVSMALWLRGLLAPDLNAALGVDTFTSPSQVHFPPFSAYY